MLEEIGTCTRTRVLGVAASLRSQQDLEAARRLTQDLLAIEDESELADYLRRRSAGFSERSDENARRHALCNSEMALAAALWAAGKQQCDIEAVSLARFFPASGSARDLGLLSHKVAAADGLIVATPTYFGDRSSLASDFWRLIATDSEISSKRLGKVYAGVAVGAKRNGGQETTLIFQILDMCAMGFLAVGNDSRTTAQYGGTCQAGDLGTGWMDRYGLWTSAGTGRRVADVLSLLHYASKARLRGKLRVTFVILQEKSEFARQEIAWLQEEFSGLMKSIVLDTTRTKVVRCLGCDRCPTESGDDRVYRCAVTDSEDWFVQHHSALIACDALVPVACGGSDPSLLSPTYQRFIERTRYLRRGDYVLGNLAVAPLVIDEAPSEALRMRLLTSMLRHQSVMTSPIAVHRDARGRPVTGPAETAKQFEAFLRQATKLTVGRLVSAVVGSLLETEYRPVGYRADTRSIAALPERGKSRTIEARLARLRDEAGTRLAWQARERV